MAKEADNLIFIIKLKVFRTMQQVVKSHAFMCLIIKRRIKSYAYILHFQSFEKSFVHHRLHLKNRIDQKTYAINLTKR